MNICFIKSDISIKGGSERVACLLMNSLKERTDWNISCLTFNYCNMKPAYDLDKRIVLEKIGNNRRLRKDIFFLIKNMRNYIIKNKIDVIINIGTGESIVSYVVKLLGGIRNIKIVSCEQSNLNNKFDGKQKRVSQKLSKFFADKIVTLTDKDRKNFIKTFNLSQEKVEYIYNFIDEKLLNREIEYNKNSKKIVSVGRLVGVKGFDRLIKIAKIVFESEVTKDWEWHILGDGPDREKLEKLIKECGLKKKVILKGNIENIYEIYNEYSFYVLTSYFEGLPMVLLEAKANKLPIISFDIDTGPSEIIQNEIDGYLIENGNLEKMKEKILLMIKDEERRLEFSKNSNLNLKKFEKNQIMDKWIKLLERI